MKKMLKKSYGKSHRLPKFGGLVLDMKSASPSWDYLIWKMLRRPPKGKPQDALGILGEQIWEHAHGIDESDMKDQYRTKK